ERPRGADHPVPRAAARHCEGVLHAEVRVLAHPHHEEALGATGVEVEVGTVGTVGVAVGGAGDGVAGWGGGWGGPVQGQGGAPRARGSAAHRRRRMHYNPGARSPRRSPWQRRLRPPRASTSSTPTTTPTTATRTRSGRACAARIRSTGGRAPRGPRSGPSR